MTTAPTTEITPQYKFDMMPEEIQAELHPIMRRIAYEERIAAQAKEPVPTDIERIIMAQVTPAKVAALEQRMSTAARIGSHIKEYKYEYLGAALTAAAIAGGIGMYFANR